MLVGPSGCGKTTLISIIAGILDQTEGDCLLFGQNLRNLDPEDAPATGARTSASCSSPSI
jgi:putative ABC transport system ATP-binding protein